MGNKKAVLYDKCRSQQKSHTAKMLTVMRQKSQQTSRTTQMLTGMRGKSQQNNRPVPNTDLIRNKLYISKQG